MYKDEFYSPNTEYYYYWMYARQYIHKYLYKNISKYMCYNKNNNNNDNDIIYNNRFHAVEVPQAIWPEPNLIDDMTV